ncbi:uncharacterized protein LOC62_06G008014 [Vanrija pseudolonga]|uniref:Uncharacterized protein n=1 Tax=Vanrija pseudolonga TaxID=143232 RepID=A0AAF1BNL2_9TREE|nr:hypothetical protein LOC62_06G008014 [Vanrija pseudolonga]
MPPTDIPHLALGPIFSQHLESFELAVKDTFVTDNADHEHVKAHLFLETLPVFAAKEVTSRLPSLGLLPLKFAGVRTALLDVAAEADGPGGAPQRPYHALIQTWDEEASGGDSTPLVPVISPVTSCESSNLELDTTGAEDKPQKKPAGSAAMDDDLPLVETPGIVESSPIHDNTISLVHWGLWRPLANPTMVTLGKNHTELMFIVDPNISVHFIGASKYLNTKFTSDMTEDYVESAPLVLIDMDPVLTSAFTDEPLNILSERLLISYGWDVNYETKLLQHPSGAKFKMGHNTGIWFISATVWWDLEPNMTKEEEAKWAAKYRYASTSTTQSLTTTTSTHPSTNSSRRSSRQFPSSALDRVKLRTPLTQPGMLSHLHHFSALASHSALSDEDVCRTFLASLPRDLEPAVTFRFGQGIPAWSALQFVFLSLVESLDWFKRLTSSSSDPELPRVVEEPRVDPLSRPLDPKDLLALNPAGSTTHPSPNAYFVSPTPSPPDKVGIATLLLSSMGDRHLVRDRSLLSDVHRLALPVVFAPLFVEHEVAALHRGTLRLRLANAPKDADLVIKNVFWAPDVPFNVLSCARLRKQGWRVDADGSMTNVIRKVTLPLTTFPNRYKAVQVRACLAEPDEITPPPAWDATSRIAISYLEVQPPPTF